MFKAAQVRAEDRQDAEAVLPRLDARARAWLQDVMTRVAPRHPWAQDL